MLTGPGLDTVLAVRKYCLKMPFTVRVNGM